MNKSIILKIIAFLIFTVGIIYIVVWINETKYSYSEGFQSIMCPSKLVGERLTYMCDNPDTAKTLVESGTVSDPICYTDSNDPNLNMSNLSNNVYICFDVNGDQQFDPITGVYMPFNPILDDDPMPGNTKQDSIINHTAFNSGYANYFANYSNTSTLANNVSTLGYANADEVIKTIESLSNSYCKPPGAAYGNACLAIDRAHANVKSYLSDTAPNSLKNINDLVTNSANEIKSVFYNKFLPGFYNSHVMKKSQIDDYLSNS